MIVNGNKSWLNMVLALKGSVIRRIRGRIVCVTAFSALVTWIELAAGLQEYSLTTTPFTLIGIAMAIFLGFRNSVSYDRFWEGRKLWGGLVNVSRSFARQTLTLLNAPDDDAAEEVSRLQQQMIRTTIANVHALRHHLRDSDPADELEDYLSSADRRAIQGSDNVPLAIQLQLGRSLRNAWQRGFVTELHMPVLEAGLTEMTALQGGCERIKNTPIPYAYNVLLHRIVAMYCFAMPFGLVETVGVLTPLVVGLISYSFFGLDAIGDDVEQPFELEDNDLPLHAICRAIERNLLQMLGESEVPPPVQPVNGVLL